MASRRLSAGTWRIRNGGWEDEIVRNLRRQRHLDGRRQTIRLQNDSADCSIYFNYGRGMAVGDFSAPLRFARNDGEGGDLGGPLSAIGFRLLAAGYRLSASGFRLSVCLRQSPPSPLRGPLPPDKQWGAREYIGARHPPLDRGGQGRSADFWLPAAGCWILASGVPSAIPPRHCVALSPLTRSGAQESI